MIYAPRVQSRDLTARQTKFLQGGEFDVTVVRFGGGKLSKIVVCIVELRLSYDVTDYARRVSELIRNRNIFCFLLFNLYFTICPVGHLVNFSN